MAYTKYLVHPYANIFPLMDKDSDEFTALYNSIVNDGLKFPIVLYQGRILDGRNRDACIEHYYKTKDESEEHEIEQTTIEFEGNDTDALAFVIASNVYRRHLNETQRAMAAARYARELTLERGKVGKAEKAVNNTFNATPSMVRLAVRLMNAQNNERALDAIDSGKLKLANAEEFVKFPAVLQEKVLSSDNPQKTFNEYKQINVRQNREATFANATVSANRSGTNGKLKFGVVYIDPPWTFETHSEEGKKKSPEQHYPTMSLEDIAGMEIPAADSCVIFLWTTVSHLSNAVSILEGWGFEYKSALFWDKINPGTGYWSRNLIEVLLIGTKGKDVHSPTPQTQPLQIMRIAKGKHSEKPEQFAEAIDKIYPNVAKIEMFARKIANRGESWWYWGNEIGDDIVRGKKKSEPGPIESNIESTVKRVVKKRGKKETPQTTNDERVSA